LGRPAVTGVSLSRPRVTFVRERDGSVNLPPPRNAEPSSSLQLGIVSVTALSIHVDDRLTQRSFTVGPLDLSVDTAGASHPFGTFGPDAFTARAGQADISGTLAGRLAFDGTRVNVDDLTVETGEGRVGMAGWMDVAGARPAVSAHGKASVDLARAARLAGVEGRVARGLAGNLEGTIDVSGALAAPDISLAVVSREAGYAPIGLFRLNGRSSFNGSRAVIDML